ncbi:doeA [Symbiodinium natans]|uniref:DoeA protein n=1 Tax=Symbiodinium natans TaxID=878477 RepID=A0A812LZA7_9DINO|nr:doeA [Symbiodinium natans]
MDTDGISVLVVVQPEDLYYLTGLYTIGDAAPQALVLPAGADPFLIARLIEFDLVPKLSWVAEVFTCPDSASIHEVFCHTVAKCLRSGCRVGLQLASISAAHYLRLRTFFDACHVECVDASKTVEKARLQKFEFELGCIRDASSMSEAALTAALGSMKPGQLLSDLHSTAYAALIAAGSEVPGYMPIVRSTDPSGHGSWLPKEQVCPGNLVFIEHSACKFGHHAPLMRTAFVLGEGESSPPAWLLEAERLIQKTFDVCLPMMVPGAKAKDIDKAGREIMLSNTSELKMSARLAYSTGSTATQPTGHAGWGDADFSLVGNNEAELQDGMTFHFIPWFQKYTQPSGPLGLSDTVLVTSDGGKRFGTLPLKMTVLNPDGSEWQGPEIA